jgi:glycogen operon protein
MKKSSVAQVSRGRNFPLGSSITETGVNFSVYSRRAHSMELLLFDRSEDRRPARVLALDPKKHRTYHYWHIEVAGVKPGQVYAWRAHGAPEEGFDAHKVLLDPYARGVAMPPHYDRKAASSPGDNTATAMKSVVVDRRCGYDWEGDHPLRTPFSKTVIYEMHVGGFTRHPSSGLDASRRGTYLGLVDKIPYLQELGVTAVELLPVYHFDAQEGPPELGNYWGYAPASFFVPHPGYCVSSDPLQQIREFKDMVKALHRAGMEVILDVVYNHTGESGETGPTFCWKGLDRQTYYLPDPQNPRKMADYTGCGNTLNGYHTVVRRLILDSLRYWVQDMHVDGFRFDLASILSRDAEGRPLKDPPILWDIESDPILAGSKLMAEAWDAAGLYQVGSFVGDSWMEWNGKFRDDVRGFLRGENGLVRVVADRLMGSPDIFAHENREVEQSINFVTCHDGFTLNDLVSYDNKHNEINREGNRDGSNDNRSWNCGHEGPTDDPPIEALRNRQVKNFLTLNLIAMGTPMLLMGDEVRRSQSGNNNAYCQNNELSWLDWDLQKRHPDILRFARTLIHYRVGRDMGFSEGLTLAELLQQSRLAWHGTRLHQPDWRDISHTLAFSVELPGAKKALHGMLNAFWEPLRFEIPPGDWKRWVDTSLPSPQDICEWDQGVKVAANYRLEARSVVLLISA